MMSDGMKTMCRPAAGLEPYGPGVDASCDVVLGLGYVTGGVEPDLVIRRLDGDLVVLELDGRGGVLRYLCAGPFDQAEIVGLADVTGDGLADLVGVTPAGEVVAYPHTGVFWPQDPSVTFGPPVPLG
jgi:hypothetical protein